MVDENNVSQDIQKVRNLESPEQENMMIQMKEVSFSYLFSSSLVLDRLNFELKKGEKIGLIGPNGSGKTTFLHILMGLLPVSAGTVRIMGKQVQTEKDFRAVRQKIGFLFQNSDDQLFSPTVLEDVAFGPLNMGKKPKEAREMSMRILESLNLKGFEDRVTHQLSGGEKKLVALATILVMEPDVLFLDEPTTALDEATRERLIHILNDLEISYIIVSHEYDFLAETTAIIYMMKKGRMIYNGESAALHRHFHRHSLGEMPHSH